MYIKIVVILSHNSRQIKAFHELALNVNIFVKQVYHYENKPF